MNSGHPFHNIFAYLLTQNTNPVFFVLLFHNFLNILLFPSAEQTGGSWKGGDMF